MSECINKRFEDMLHAFELGMLSDKDYNEFQMHLLDCEYCFERARKLEPAAEMIRNDCDFQEISRQMADEKLKQKERDDQRKTEASKFRFWPTLVPVSAVAALILIFLILKPWHIEIQTDRLAIAAQNRLAVMYFNNIEAPEDSLKLGEITANLLITDLSESGYLQVISSQRLYDIFRLMDDAGNIFNDPEIASQIADQSGAKWMLTGNILQTKPQLILTSQIVDIESGDIIASQKVTGDNNEDIFSLVDKLTIQVKRDLSLPFEAEQESDRRVADVTTNSPLAYRYYLEGVVQYHRYYNDEAIKSFNKALEIDSSFAMVYYYLSLIEKTTMIDKAILYLDRASRENGHFIRSRKEYLNGNYERAIIELEEILKHNTDNKEAYFQIGICYSMILDFEKSIEYCKKALEIDPLYKIVYNRMAYTYDWMGDFENAIQSIDMYISIAPEEANPYDSRGDLYMTNGELELAIESYSKALSIKPDFWASLYKIGKNNLLLGKFNLADSCFNVLANCENRTWRSNGLAGLALAPIFNGKFDEALRILNSGIDTLRSEGSAREYALFNCLKAIVFEEKNQPTLALKEIEEAIRIQNIISPDNPIYNNYLLGHLNAKAGNIAKAEEITEYLWKNIKSANDTLRYWYAVAFIDYAKGDLDKAVISYEKAAADSVIPFTPANCYLAVTYYETGRYADAIAELKEMLENDVSGNRFSYGSWTAKAHYYIGLSYEELGQIDLAIEHYQIFLDLWKDADPYLVIIDKAKERLSRITTKL